MLSLSMYLFGGAFAAYTVSTLLFLLHVTGTRWFRRSPSVTMAAGGVSTARVGGVGPTARAIWARRALLLGLAAQAVATGLRWYGSGHAPLSNMFEFMSFNAWAILAIYAGLDRELRLPTLGVFVVPLGVIMLSYASIFPINAQPLIPALQSYWLPLHVSMAATGDAAFMVSAVAGFMYMLRVRTQGETPREAMALEGILYLLCCLVAFIGIALTAKAMGFSQMVEGVKHPYTMPPLIGPATTMAGDLGRLGAIPLPVLSTPEWMDGPDAPRKLTSMIYAGFGGLFLYGALRAALGRPLRELASQPVAGLDPDVLDDVGYRAVAVGFPIFTLGGIVFAMLWAEKAWGSYWSWDPKETWALITWLFYAGYLHLRLQRGLEGRPSAWVLVGGFMVVLFTLVGVNLLIAGMHSYVGA